MPDDWLGLLRELGSLVRARYVFPDMAERVAAALEQRAAAGEYGTCASLAALCGVVTAHMQAESGDQHLELHWCEQPIEEAAAEAPPDLATVERFRRLISQSNFGIERVERLAGNVGYLDYRRFDSPPFAAESVAAAMRLLAHTSALILDLRRNGGGDAAMVPFVASYFFGDEPVQLSGLYQRATDSIQQSWTQPYVPGTRYTERPVYVLIGRDTFSAGEALAYDLKHLRRASLIGERTRGGAHPREAFRLSAHCEAYVPVARAINPITGANWEGTGVEPDLPVPEAEALTTAYRQALEAVIGRLGALPAWPAAELYAEAQQALAGLG